MVDTVSAGVAVVTHTTEPARPSASQPDWRKIVLVELAFLLGVAFIWLLWQMVAPISHTVVLFLLGAAFAFVLADPSDWLAERLGGRRMLGILLTYLLVFVAVIGGIMLLAVPLARQANELAIALPGLMGDIQARISRLQDVLLARGIQLDLDGLRAQWSTSVVGSADVLLASLVGQAAALGGALADTVLILVISVYLLAGAPAIHQNTLKVVPGRYRGVHEFVRTSAARVMGGYLRGQLTMSLVIGVLAGIGTGLLGLPYFVVLGVLAGLFELVPMFGPVLSAVPAVVVALFQPWPTVVWVVIFFFLIQQFESNVLGPRITGHAVGLHPLAALFALLVGFEVAGILGGLFAVPIAGVLWVLASAAYNHFIGTLAAPAIAAPVGPGGPTPGPGLAVDGAPTSQVETLS
jgi:predicted PurR-regulated permease PerM